MGAPPTDPQPGRPHLPDLIQCLRDAGYDLTLRADGLDDPLPPGLSLNVYRIVEEALTNITRHSTARTGTISVRITTGWITVDVEDPGPQVRPTHKPPTKAAGSGRGLLGMAERVDLYGGTLRSGHTPTGGFLSAPQFGATAVIGEPDRRAGDDHALVRVAFRAIFQAHGIRVVGEAGDGDEAIAVTLENRPDVVLMDVRMPRRDGLSAIDELRVRSPRTRIIVLTSIPTKTPSSMPRCGPGPADSC